MQLTNKQLLIYSIYALLMFLPQLLILLSVESKILDDLVEFPGWHLYILVLMVCAMVLRSFLIKKGWIEDENKREN